MKFGVKNLFKKGLDVHSRAITSEITSKTSRKKLIDEGIKHAPELYKLAPLKLKIKTRKVLESDVANYIVKETRTKAKKYI